MNQHVSANPIGVEGIERRPGGRRARVTLNGVLWTLQVLFGFFFAGSGFGKVLLYDGALYAAAPRAVAWYAAVPQPLIVFIGVAEVLGGIGLVLPAMTGVRPKLTPLAGAGLTLTMILAAGFHIVRGEYDLVPATVLLGAVAGVVAVGRWRLRPVAPAAVTTSGVLRSAAVLGALALLVFAPTWYTMTNVHF
ncbi:DoxX family protein [Nonomuraea rhodomycinica]|uniref:DoxX family protein n=1 Tax=Nonomuraea rhodomycinica TaxID=1712872 RepID=A0A7Y6MAG8_9ACTN|nr:DoxX family protein [Nonomuraea rhodomycinica]NUW41208.1 DoxX family protein [Nonomuraea rhodomycinica]